MRLSRQLVAKSSSSSCWKNVSSVVARNNAYVKVSGLECKKFLQGICTVDTGRYVAWQCLSCFCLLELTHV
jgi:folate-binding Fe-S cluster repair protein YgfZ